jgi:hypothetical protein
MISSFVDEVHKSGTPVPSFSASEGEEALVITAKKLAASRTYVNNVSASG